ncbi:MAG TPA: response regulator transcription factor [Terriglobales bacterium]|nr:response regulator transcription factor [Terriglobales bacterium]
MDLPRRAAPIATDSPITVAITAQSAALRAKIGTTARRAGAQVVAESAQYEILLLAVDSSTTLPESIAASSLLVPRAALVCLVWTASPPTHESTSRLLRAGVAGIVSLTDIGRFQAALQAIRAGLQVLDPALTTERDQGLIKARSPEDLTEREQQVLTMMADGLANKEIASQLGISTHTVKFHISSILGKLGASSRTEAVSIGIRSGRVVI